VLVRARVGRRCWRHLLTAVTLALVDAPAMAIDVDALWMFSRPEVSEQRFRAALMAASDDERGILLTQIARTHGLRGEFEQARQILAGVAPTLENASAEVRVRYFLELGRTYASPAHPQTTQTVEARETARGHYLRAFALAEAAQLDALAIDALHMMAMVDTAPEQQLEWDERALAYMEKSRQPDAWKWEASLRNNIGYAKRLQGDYAGALEQFRLSRLAHEKRGSTRNVRIADWMIARTYRAMGRVDDAIALQLELERAWDADGEPDPEVYEELALLFRAKGDEQRAAHYETLHRAASK
jgi:tetratricopeptide (TPR) repeat protein